MAIRLVAEWHHCAMEVAKSRNRREGRDVFPSPILTDAWAARVSLMDAPEVVTQRRDRKRLQGNRLEHRRRTIALVESNVASVVKVRFMNNAPFAVKLNLSLSKGGWRIA